MDIREDSKLKNFDSSGGRGSDDIALVESGNVVRRTTENDVDTQSYGSQNSNRELDMLPLTIDSANLQRKNDLISNYISNE